MTTITRSRIGSIDFLRGLIMIIMALDHVRDYFNASNFLYDPLDLDKTSVILFFTRWITHFCAPVFMLLAGVSAFIIGQKKSKKELSGFLLKRGLWLVFLEIVVVNFGWNFNIAFPNLLFVTIWALGISMIVLAALIHLSPKIILAVSLLLVFGHNLLDNIHVPGNTLPAFGWSLLHDQNFFTWGNEGFLVGYPLLPWIGVMPLGYCLGRLYTPAYDAGKRKKNLLLMGFSAILLFIVIRYTNVYGDPSKWTVQPTAVYTFLSFLKVSKYPPSLLYLLVTLGPALVVLAVTEQLRSPFAKVVAIYGRVPMFYYIIHIYLIHLLAMIASQLFTPVGWQAWLLKQPIWFNTDLKGYGFSLGVVYLVWIAVVVVLYPWCKRYDLYKQSHKEKWWLSYM
ncbi:MAG: heparan-alpha-glucosaminide N-acetyltransferase domain-containing protein [Chitinophagaceae bacterium]